MAHIRISRDYMYFFLDVWEKFHWIRPITENQGIVLMCEVIIVVCGYIMKTLQCYDIIILIMIIISNMITYLISICDNLLAWYMEKKMQKPANLPAVFILWIPVIHLYSKFFLFIFNILANNHLFLSFKNNYKKC
jgi:hypothetical protein